MFITFWNMTCEEKVKTEVKLLVQLIVAADDFFNLTWQHDFAKTVIIKGDVARYEKFILFHYILAFLHKSNINACIFPHILP